MLVKIRNNMTAEEIIKNSKRKYEVGFTSDEIVTMLVDNDIDPDKFYTALGVNTITMIDGNFVTYFWDIERALDCVINDRDMDITEWD
jgi:hypothetical protein